MLDWLLQKRQTPSAIDRFWRQVLVSAVNEDLDRMAAIHGFQVFWQGFLSKADAYEMGVPAIPLGQLYGADAWKRLPNVRIHQRATVERIDAEGFTVNGERRKGDIYICALPFERLEAVGLSAQSWNTRRSRESTCGSTARSPICRMPHCSTALSNGCSIRIPGAICNWW